VKAPFEIAWLGGTAEHYFRKARPGADDLPWGTLADHGCSPAAIDFARDAWTQVAINEYRAVASFGEVLRSLVAVNAPLDLLGMTSDFLADECAHVELASRLAMELGGATPHAIDFEQFGIRSGPGTAFQRANEIVLRVGCIAEAFSGGTASASFGAATHPLPRAVFERILQDEAHHRRLGGLYFEWALPRIDEAELTRLGRVLGSAIRAIAPFWTSARARGERGEEGPALGPRLPEGELARLGWPAPHRFAPVARDVVVKDIVEPLATIGIVLPEEDRALLES
jgi:hypothetical protein